MPFASSISPERRARLRRLRAEFEAAFDLVGDRGDRSSPAYAAADARYRAWITALDDVAMALLDDIDACEANCAGTDPAERPRPAPARAGAEPADIDRLLRGDGGHQSAVDLIGAAPAPLDRPRASTPKSRAMGVVGADRVARHWTVTLGTDRPAGLAECGR